MEKYQNKYRIKSHRMPHWDYSANGVYFLTIVTQNRVCNLGEIIIKKMKLSDFGEIVKTEFLKSFEIRDELFLSDYVIMPNHIHTIIILDKLVNGGIVETHGHVETHGRVSLQYNKNNNNHNRNRNIKIKQNPPIRQPKSISSFMAGFKSSVNTKIDNYIDENNLDIPKYNKNNHFFQPNYHDHIIRNENEYNRISKYIATNPANWDDDKFNDNN